MNRLRYVGMALIGAGLVVLSFVAACSTDQVNQAAAEVQTQLDALVAIRADLERATVEMAADAATAAPEERDELIAAIETANRTIEQFGAHIAEAQAVLDKVRALSDPESGQVEVDDAVLDIARSVGGPAAWVVTLGLLATKMLQYRRDRNSVVGALQRAQVVSPELTAALKAVEPILKLHYSKGALRTVARERKDVRLAQINGHSAPSKGDL